MSTTDTNPRFIFMLRAVGDGPAEALRVRKLLKDLGRRHGLKVTWPDPALKLEPLANNGGETRPPVSLCRTFRRSKVSPNKGGLA